MGNANQSRTTCPRCKWNLLSERKYALSRRDNVTHICPECGTQEALEDSRLVTQWLDIPTNMPYWNTQSDVWMAQEEKQQDEEAGLTELKEEANEAGWNDGPYGRIS